MQLSRTKPPWTSPFSSIRKSRLTVKSKPSGTLKVRNAHITLPIFVLNNPTFSLGVKKILEERGQWYHDLKGNAWKFNCGSPGASCKKYMCCASHFLSSRPDFENQKSALRDIVEGAGHIFEMYPKYHCETNWIEIYWGAAKREARLKCNYTFASLDANVNNYLDHVSDPKRIRKYFQHCMNYIDAYSQGHNAQEVALDIKKFTSEKIFVRDHLKIIFVPINCLPLRNHSYQKRKFEKFERNLRFCRFKI